MNYSLIEIETLRDLKDHLSSQLLGDLAILENAEMLTLLTDNDEMQIALFEKEEAIRMRIDETKRLLEKLNKAIEINEAYNNLKKGAGSSD